ncbi:MAG TPA: SDR family oxidoreductase [Eudoraea sp.]|nr:SDR family oxidoreductase [Eudoraea sp.]
MKFSLASKTAVVTGGGSGIGKAIARALAEQGALVHVLDINPDHSTRTVDEIKEAGGNAVAHTCNVSLQDNVRKVMASLMQHSNIDILINNAGIGHIGNVESTEEADMDHLYEVNIKGVYNCIQAAIPSMKENGGVILNMASVAGTVGISDRFAYAMTKGAVLTMTYSVAKDYLDHGIRCNSISPGRVHTPFVDSYLEKNYPDNKDEMFEKLAKTQPIGRMGRPEEIADLAVYLCSDEASFITGTDFPIDGGFIKLNG